MKKQGFREFLAYRLERVKYPYLYGAEPGRDIELTIRDALMTVELTRILEAYDNRDRRFKN